MNWQRALPEGAFAAAEIADIEWEHWEGDFADEVSGPMGAAMEAGADAARRDVVGITIDWSLQSDEAVAWMRRQSLSLAKDITATTRKRLRASLAAGLETGEDMATLGQRVKALCQDMATWRAELIGQTETINAYTQGSLQAYKASGVVERKSWLDGQAGACPLCQALNGIEVALDAEFPGGFDGPPRHPGCRCAVRGIVEGAPEPGKFENLPQAEAWGRANGIQVVAGEVGLEDWNRVSTELERVPAYIRDTLRAKGATINLVVNKGVSAAPRLAHLKGVSPRGYPDGWTWDAIPACAGATGITIVANSEWGCTAITHEVGHVADILYGRETASVTKLWLELHKEYAESVVAGLTVYERNYPEEFFAESFRRWCTPEAKAYLTGHTPRVVGFLDRWFRKARRR